MSVERDIRFDLIARLCPNTTGAELRSVATEAGMFAIRARRKVATERDFLDSVEKVVRQGTKFSSTYVLPVVSAVPNSHSRIFQTIISSV
jgi:26S proteasome regulatory subunit T1